MPGQLIKMGATEAYEILGDILTDITSVRFAPTTANRDALDKILEETEKKLSKAMQWVYGIKEL